MKRIAILLILTMVSTVIIACGNSPIENNETKRDETVSAAEETTVPSEKPNFSDSNYSGRKFTILYPQWALINLYYFTEEANGDAMNDAAYERFQKINEELGI